MNREEIISTDTSEQAPINVEEKIASLFEPDALVSAQYFDNLRRKSLLEPEMRLILAILEDGVRCFQDNLLAESAKAKKLFKEAEEWFSHEDGDWIFSFRNVCELLGLNPEYVRRGLLRWKAKQLADHLKPLRWEATKMAG